MHFRIPVPPNLGGCSGLKEYGKAMPRHDNHLGAILKQLDGVGLADNTIVILGISDRPQFDGCRPHHAGARAAGGCRG